MQNSVLCFQANVLHAVCRHVPFSRCPNLKAQSNSKVLSSCGLSLVGVDVHNVALARVLGVPDSANSSAYVLAANVPNV